MYLTITIPNIPIFYLISLSSIILPSPCSSVTCAYKQGQRREKAGSDEDRGRRDERKKTMIRRGIKTFPVLTVTRCSKQSDPFQSTNCNNTILPMENAGKITKKRARKGKKQTSLFSSCRIAGARVYIQ